MNHLQHGALHGLLPGTHREVLQGVHALEALHTQQDRLAILASLLGHPGGREHSMRSGPPQYQRTSRQLKEGADAWAVHGWP